ncbi:MAG: DUF11 domain-containing protein [Chloroflexaceae bacterium]|nr:DUF11 domain-containing protein [Chloroflexaceae bacterium]
MDEWLRHRNSRLTFVLFLLALFALLPFAMVKVRGATPPPTPEESPGRPPSPWLPGPSRPTGDEGSPADEEGEPQNLPLSAVTMGVEVQLPATVLPGDEIIYTYVYTNTGDENASRVELEAIWTNFSPEPSTNGSVWQYCASGCAVIPGSVVGPSVNLIEEPDISGKARYNIGTLGAGEGGRFSVLLQTNQTIYPRTNGPLIRPSGSARIFFDRSSVPAAEHTNLTMLIGPILSISKEATTSDSLYPLQEGTFTLHIGNATNPGDVKDGHIRQDARKATNIVVEDTWPQGSEFVASDSDYLVDGGTADNPRVRWEIPGPLLPGQMVDLPVSYRKLNQPVQCGMLKSNGYYVTSDEIPFQNEDEQTRYHITDPGGDPSITVVTPVKIASITVATQDIPFGDATNLIIRVENFYDQAVNGGQLMFDLPSDVAYLSANPSPSSAPDGSETGGTVTWTFDIGAGSIATPAVKELTVQVRGSFANNTSSGRASFAAPANIPSACTEDVTGGSVNIRPRLSYQITPANSGAEVNFRNNYFVQERGEHFQYTIEIINEGSTTAEEVVITNNLPGTKADGACFAYVDDSATLDGQPFEPTNPAQEGEEGTCGMVVWEGVTVPGNTTLRLSYRLRVDGYYYTTYRNSATVKRGDETITSHGPTLVLMEISPPLRVTKSVDRTSGLSPKERVNFTLRVSNTGSQYTYNVGLYDVMGSFVFAEQTAGGYTDQREEIPLSNDVWWEMVPLGPGEEIAVTFSAFVDSSCPSAQAYTNEANFLVESVGVPLLVRMIPAASVQVAYQPPPECNPTPTPATPTRTPSPSPTSRFPTFTPTPLPPTSTPVPGTANLKYVKKVDRAEASLGDILVYTIEVRNENKDLPVIGVTVRDMLPEGFSYVEMDPSSDVTSRPRIEPTTDNRLELTWNDITIESLETFTIRYLARTGNVVGQYQSQVSVLPPDEVWSATPSGDIAPMTIVKPLMTIAPSFDTGRTCEDQRTTIDGNIVLLNTNTHEYTNTTVIARLPIGLSFVQVLGTTPAPDSIEVKAGQTVLTWYGLGVPASDGPFTQVVMEVRLQLGDVWEPLNLSIEATSPDGIIPPWEKREGISLEPDIVPCAPERPTMGKVVDQTSVAVGDEFRYQVTLANPTDEAITASVEDVLPSSVQFIGMVRGPVPEIVTDTNTLVWNDLVVPARVGEAAQTVVLEYRVRLMSGTIQDAYTNRATVIATSSSTPFETTTSEVPVRVAPGVVKLTKQAERSKVGLYDEAVYSLEVRNENTLLAVENVTVRDTLPRGFTYIGLDPSSVVTDEPLVETVGAEQTRLRWTLPRLEASEVLTITYHVRTSGVLGQHTNFATLSPPSGWTTKPTGGSGVPVSITPLTIISATLKVSETCDFLDTVVPYEFEIVNTNPQAFPDTTVVISLPIGLRYLGPLNDSMPEPVVRATRDGLTTTLTWRAVPVPGASEGLFGRVRIGVNLQVGHVWHTLKPEIAASTPYGSIPQQTVEGQPDTLVPCLPEELPAIGKEVNPPNAPVGSLVFYQITLVNPKAEAVSGVSVEDTFPDNMEFVRMVQGPEPVFDPLKRNTIAWNDLTIPRTTPQNNGTLVLQYQLRLKSGALQSHHQNRAVVISEEPFEPDEDTTEITIIPPEQETGNIEYAKEVNRSRASLKDRLVYTLSVRNTSTEEPASNVRVEDILPAGFTFVRMDPSGSVTTAPEMEQTIGNQTRLTWTFPSLGTTEVVTLTYVALTGEEPGVFSSSLSVVPPEGWSAMIASEGATVSVTVMPLATVEASFTSPWLCENPGQQVTYRVEVVNQNVYAYGGTTAVITLPMGLNYVEMASSSPVPWIRRDLDHGTVQLEWDDLTVPAPSGSNLSASLVLDVVCEVGETWSPLEVASHLSSTDGIIVQQGAMTDTITVCSPSDPRIGKVVDHPYVQEQNPFDYQVSVVNPRTTSITGVTIEDVLPEHTEFVQMVPEGGAAPTTETVSDSLKLSWSGLTVPAGSDEEPGILTLRYRTRIMTGTVGERYHNTASVMPSETFAISSTMAWVTLLESPGSGDGNLLPPTPTPGPAGPLTVYLPLIRR